MNRALKNPRDDLSKEAHVLHLRAFMDEHRLSPCEAAQRFDVDASVIDCLLQSPDSGLALGLETLVCMVLAAGMPSPGTRN